MTSLKKDGTPVVPICVECKFFEDGSYPWCRSPNRPGSFDTVYGKVLNTMRCEDARKSNDLCGTAGNWYEAKPPKAKPSLLDRIIRWVDRL